MPLCTQLGPGSTGTGSDIDFPEGDLSSTSDLIFPPSISRPEAVVKAMRVLEVHKQLDQAHHHQDVDDECGMKKFEDKFDKYGIISSKASVGANNKASSSLFASSTDVDGIRGGKDSQQKALGEEEKALLRQMCNVSKKKQRINNSL